MTRVPGRISALASSYRGRLVFGYALVVVLFAVAWVWSLFGPVTGALVGQQKTELTSIARAGATLASNGTSPAVVSKEMSQAGGARITIVAADGTVLVDSAEDAATMENHATRPEVAAALAGRMGEAQRVSRTEGTEQLYVAAPATIQGRPAAVRASQNVASIDQVAARARRSGLVLLVFALGLATAIAVRVSRGLVGPIRELSAAAKDMAAGDLGREVPRERGELGVLAAALAEMRAQIRTRIEDLQREQDTMRAVLDGLDDAVFLLEGETIAFANSAADVIFRSPGGGWRGRNIGDAGLPASLAAWAKRRVGTTSPRTEELTIGPAPRSLRATAIPLEERENKPEAILVVSDITERAGLERVRRDFVANASHELKTPVAGIQLLAESAADAAADGDDMQAVAFARQIAQESSRLQRLVRDLLDLSRLEAVPAPGSITDVREGITNGMLGHRPAAAARGLTLTLDDSAVSGEDIFIVADPTDFAVALDNLLDNALTYTQEGGVTIGIHATPDEVFVSVADTGIGIPAADLPRIFERFYRVDRARSRDSGGTGLGLALVRHAVDRAGGSVSVESTPGRGSRFELKFTRAH